MKEKVYKAWFDSGAYRKINQSLDYLKAYKIICTEKKEALEEFKLYAESSEAYKTSRAVKQLVHKLNKLINVRYMDRSSLVSRDKKRIISKAIKSHLDILEPVTSRHIERDDYYRLLELLEEEYVSLELILLSASIANKAYYQTYGGLARSWRELSSTIGKDRVKWLMLTVPNLNKHKSELTGLAVEIERFEELEVRNLKVEEVSEEEVSEVIGRLKDLMVRVLKESEKVEYCYGIPEGVVASGEARHPGRGPHKGGGGMTVKRVFRHMHFTLSGSKEGVRDLDDRKPLFIKGLNIDQEKNQLLSVITNLLVHVYFSQPTGKDANDAVPLPNAFIRGQGYRLLTRLKVWYYEDNTWKVASSIHALKVLGLFSVVNPYVKRKKARSVKLSAFSEALVSSYLLGGHRLEFRDIEPQKPYFVKGKRDIEWVEAEGEIPDVIPNKELYEAAFKNVKPVVINLKKYQEKMAEKLRFCDMSLETYISTILEAQAKGTLQSLEQDIKDFANYGRDLKKMSAGYRLKGSSKTNSTISFNWIGRISYTGRIFQHHGAQNVCRLSKSVLYEGKVNYDMINAQLACLLHLLREAGSRVSLKPLEAYVRDSSVRDKIVKAIGISKEDWKASVYATLFGADPETKLRSNSIPSILSKYKGNSRFKEKVFKQELDKIKVFVDEWYRLLPAYAKARELSSEHQPWPRSLHNGVVCINAEDSRLKSKAKLSAFFIQGLETQFILQLMSNSKAQVLSYEFDGLVVAKELTTKALKATETQSNFTEAKLAIKEFL